MLKIVGGAKAPAKVRLIPEGSAQTSVRPVFFAC